MGTYTVKTGGDKLKDRPLEETLSVLHLDESKMIHLIKKNYYDTEFIDLRMFYRCKDGKILPTKKGVILNTDQWQELLPSLLRGLDIDLEDVE